MKRALLPLLLAPSASWAAVYPAGGFTAAQTAGLLAQLFLAWFAGYWVGTQIKTVRQTVEVS